jgi:hypothetical protein
MGFATTTLPAQADVQATQPPAVPSATDESRLVTRRQLGEWVAEQVPKGLEDH